MPTAAWYSGRTDAVKALRPAVCRLRIDELEVAGRNFRRRGVGGNIVNDQGDASDIITDGYNLSSDNGSGFLSKPAL